LQNIVLEEPEIDAVPFASAPDVGRLLGSKNPLLNKADIQTVTLCTKSEQ